MNCFKTLKENHLSKMLDIITPYGCAVIQDSFLSDLAEVVGYFIDAPNIFVRIFI